MSNYKVYVTVEGDEDTTTLEARSPIEAAFIAGAALGAGIAASDPAISLMARLLGVGEVQRAIEDTLREDLDSVLVEEL